MQFLPLSKVSCPVLRFNLLVALLLGCVYSSTFQLRLNYDCLTHMILVISSSHSIVRDIFNTGRWQLEFVCGHFHFCLFLLW